MELGREGADLAVRMEAFQILINSCKSLPSQISLYVLVSIAAQQLWKSRFAVRPDTLACTVLVTVPDEALGDEVVVTITG